MLTVTDAAAVDRCFEAGIGAEVTLRGRRHRRRPAFFSPVDADRPGRHARRRPLRHRAADQADATSAGSRSSSTAGCRVVLTADKAPQLDASIYHRAGLWPQHARIVQVKSAGGFRAAYDPFAAATIYVDTPGPADSDLTRLPFRRIDPAAVAVRPGPRRAVGGRRRLMPAPTNAAPIRGPHPRIRAVVHVTTRTNWVFVLVETDDDRTRGGRGDARRSRAAGPRRGRGGGAGARRRTRRSDAARPAATPGRVRRDGPQRGDRARSSRRSGTCSGSGSAHRSRSCSAARPRARPAVRQRQPGDPR